jgi:putative ABC transport system substrate-binding protein
MKRREFIALLGAAAAAWPLGARAQQGEKVYKIGILSAGSAVPGPTMVADLRELGYVEGKNLTFERRYAEDRLDRLPKFAGESVSLKMDVIMAAGTLAPLAAKRATSTIPIVMMAAGDPVGSGLVASLARPGGNVTGTSLMAPDQSPIAYSIRPQSVCGFRNPHDLRCEPRRYYSAQRGLCGQDAQKAQNQLTCPSSSRPNSSWSSI